jgi:hypothetical protein
MNPYRVVTEQELKDHLTKLGYSPTKETTATGTIWVCKITRKHILIPFPYEEMYPDFILEGIKDMIGKIRPTLQ